MKNIDGIRRSQSGNKKSSDLIPGAARRTRSRPEASLPSSAYDFLKPHRNRQAAIAATVIITITLVIVWLTVLLPSNPVFKKTVTTQPVSKITEELSNLFSEFSNQLKNVSTNESSQDQIKNLETKVFPQFNNTNQ